MTLSKKILPSHLTLSDGEERHSPSPCPSPSVTEDDSLASHSPRRRRDSLEECGEAGSLAIPLHRFVSLSPAKNFNAAGLGNYNGAGYENQGVSGFNLEGFFPPSTEKMYSFYLGPELSPWGPSGPPLLTYSGSTTTAVSRGAQRRRRTEGRNAEFPPLLTTLDGNGRPRFNLKKMRNDGRLEIASVAVDRPEIVRVRGGEGLRIGTVRIDKGEQEHEEGQS